VTQGANQLAPENLVSSTESLGINYLSLAGVGIFVSVAFLVILYVILGRRKRQVK